MFLSEIMYKHCAFINLLHSTREVLMNGFLSPDFCPPVSVQEGEVAMAAMVWAGLMFLIASIINHSLILFPSLSVLLSKPIIFLLSLIMNTFLLVSSLRYIATSLSLFIHLLPSVLVVVSQDSTGFLAIVTAPHWLAHFPTEKVN